MPASVLATSEPSSSPTESSAPARETVATRAHPAVLRPTLYGIGLGGAQGALLYGGIIAILHARHNTIGVWDALVLLGWCLLVYGAGAAMASGAAMLVLRLLRFLRGGRATQGDDVAPSIAGDASSTAVKRDATAGKVSRTAGSAQRLASRATTALGDRSLRRDLWLATAAFHFAFWLFAASYGLTYDEAPRWVTTAWPMLAYLVLRSLVVLAAAALAAWLLVAIAAAVARRRRAWRFLTAAVLLLAVAQVATALVSRDDPRETPPLPHTLGARSGTKVAVVGVDGADWRVILPLVERGELPNLARLMREGSWGPLSTFPDSNSAVIWASIYTGRRPAVHGVLDFYTVRLAGMSGGFFGVYPVHRTFFKELAMRLQGLGLAEVQPIDRANVAAPLVWEVASSTGRSVGVVDGYYYSYPAPVLADPRSFFLGYGSDGLWQQAHEARRAITPTEAALQAWPAGLIAEEGRFLAKPDFEWQTSALFDLLQRRGQPDFVSLYTHEPDAVQHAKWRYHEPARFFGVDAAAAPAKDEIVGFYHQLDAFLGRLRARLEPGTVLAVVSDHGHSPTIFHSMDTQHRHGPPGVLLLHGGPIRAGKLPASTAVLDVYPTLLYLLGIPLPADADGQLLSAAVDPAFLRQHAAQRVSTWDGLPRPKSAAPPDRERRRLELEKLRSLGYVR